MLDKRFKKALENPSVDLEEIKIVNKMNYIMNFGEFTIQYEFSLN
tara:strand:- start:648 stop:782 length:135 start_codon:yes stop_codon:yes gene_type:complete